jgi:hypothetical protein
MACSEARSTRSIRRRTASGLLTLAHVRTQERTRLLDAKRAAEVARRKAEDEANRARYLDQLGKHMIGIVHAGWRLRLIRINVTSISDYRLV